MRLPAVALMMVIVTCAAAPASAVADCSPILPVSTCPPPGPPSVEGNGTSTPSTTTATLSGTVDPNGLATSYHFAYGTSDYNLNSSTAQLPAQRGPIKVSATVTGLTPATVYRFELIATNADGTSRGDSNSFMTDRPPEPALKVGQPHLSRQAIALGSTVRVSSRIYNGWDTWRRYYNSPLMHLDAWDSWYQDPGHRPRLQRELSIVELPSSGRIEFSIRPDHDTLIRIALQDPNGPYAAVSSPISVLVFPKLSLGVTRNYYSGIVHAYFQANVHVLPAHYGTPMLYFYRRPAGSAHAVRFAVRRLRYRSLTNEQGVLTATAGFADQRAGSVYTCVRSQLVRDMGVPFDNSRCGKPVMG